MLQTEYHAAVFTPLVQPGVCPDETYARDAIHILRGTESHSSGECLDGRELRVASSSKVLSKGSGHIKHMFVY
jgi:hypothetical protein